MSSEGENINTNHEGESSTTNFENASEKASTHEFREQYVQEITEQVSNLFVENAKKYLGDDQELMDAVVDFYSDQARLSTELGNVFKDKSDEEIHEHVENIEKMCNSQQEFRKFTERYIESFQSTAERANSFKRRDVRLQENPFATETEYELGAYKESMEAQVSDAVFEFATKGYHPFESGMDEDPSSREQFIGFYDTEVSIPDELIELLKTEGFEIYVEEMDDRTQIRITPPDDRKIKSSEWKTVWNQVAHHFSKNKNKDLKNTQVYGYHQKFREFQDTLKQSWVG